MKISLTVVCLCLGLSFAYKLKCPDASQWAIRARHLCPDPSKYSCLLDDNADVYIENCKRFDKTRRGERYLIRGDFDSHFCSKDFYQPFTYLTNVSSDCIYTKSLCNEEGQVIYDNADPDKDRKCTCDHTRGYDFVTRPSNPCYCVPSEEDCSCYLNPCMMSDLFQIDDRCTNRTQSSVKNNCVPFKNSSKEERRNLTEHNEQTTNIVSERENMSHKAFLASILCIIAVIGLSVIIVIFQDAVDNILNEYFIKVYVIDQLKNISCIEGGECILQCELSKSNFPVQWYKDDKTIDITDNNMIKTCESRHHKLSFKSMSRVYAGQYQLGYGKNVMMKASIRLKEMPHAVKQLSEENKKLYMSIVKYGTEVRRYIRILILGKESVGKSCLLRRLLCEGIEDVKSTDGIDIVVRRCRIRLSDGKWIFDGVTDRQENDFSRIKGAMVGKTDAQKLPEPPEQSGSELVVPDETDKERTPNPTNQAENENASKPTLLTSMTSTVTDNDEKLPDKADAHNQPSCSSDIKSSKPTPYIAELTENVLNVTTGKDIEELANSLTGIDTFEMPPEFVECGFWDFAGEKDYYATHQIFLHSYALYLLVADMSEDGKQVNTDENFDSIGGYMDFWLDNIHSHRVKTTTEDTKFDPPVIVVGTNTDKCEEKCKDEAEFQKKKKDFEDIAYNKEKKRQHIRDIHFVSNTEPDKNKFNELRKAIFEQGKSLQTYDEELPLRWIQLERSFDAMRNQEKDILPWNDVYKLSSAKGIDDKDEINLFLNYQHKVGSIIFFEEIPDYIILKPKWLADVFRCLISNKIDNELKLTPAWKKLTEHGELEQSVIEQLFKKGSELKFKEHQDHILKVMEAFETIIRPNNTSSYYMPCMIESGMSLDAVLKAFEVRTDIRTPWLCIEFDFMPLLFFNHILVYFIKEYQKCLKPSTNSEQPAIYHGMGVFFIDNEERIKLLVYFCKNTVAVQLWHWIPITKGTCKKLLLDLQNLIKNLKTKYEAKRIECTVKAKCAHGNIQETAGRISYLKLKDSTDGKYMCHEHNTYHESKEIYQTWYEGYNEGIEGQSGAKGARGYAETKGAQGEGSFVGAAGPPGPNGQVGPIGAPGQPGEMGLPGEPGIRGGRCPSGPAGRQGATVEPGREGENGISGNPGPQGPAGITGPMGEIGLPGNPGPDGAPCLQEQQGEKEPDGDLGIPGSLGQMGCAGEPGPVGINSQSGGRGSSVDNSIYSMAKTAFAHNRVKIVQGLANADDVASHLFASRLFTLEMLYTILQEEENEMKNHKILDTLNYRGKQAVKGLHDAFLDTENQELAELLAEYVKVIEIDDNKFIPSVWPPLLDEQKRMESEPVRRIKDIKSPLVAHEYTSSEVYEMRNKTRGMVFMINNVNFSEKKLARRAGSDVDAHNLRKLFVGLQFKVVEGKDQGGVEMLKFLEEERGKVNWAEMECMILIIMSHGNSEGIYGVDGIIVDLDKMTNIFKACPGLNEKPKLVFVQADRTREQKTAPTQGYGGIQVTDRMKQLTANSKDLTDAVMGEDSEEPMTTFHSDADFLIAYATPQGCLAYRNIEVGSWFLNAIVWTFKYHADQQEIQQLLLKVNRLVSMGRTSKGGLQVPEISNKLRKKFFFFPGIYNDPPELLYE